MVSVSLHIVSGNQIRDEGSIFFRFTKISEAKKKEEKEKNIGCDKNNLRDSQSPTRGNSEYYYDYSPSEDMIRDTK